MTTATYAMREAYTTIDELAHARETAVRTHDQFVDTAAAYLSNH
ncbi:hypothetical protein ACIRQP_41715 [Streptomyces sp. NPDC102274]